MAMFRDLHADEIECRVSQCSEKGVSLLLYKDARCDQNILDETVGAMNWMRHHCRENANCIVSLWDEKKGQWVDKEDTGTESNTEKEKGLASDSFKRACFNWGIGRELYTAPFVWIKAEDCKSLKQNDKGKWQCFDSFEVKGITIESKRITGLTIKNCKTNKVVFTMGKTSEEPTAEHPVEPSSPTFKRAEIACAVCGKTIQGIKKNGVPFKTAQEVIDWSRDEFDGEAHCWACAKKKLDRREEQA